MPLRHISSLSALRLFVLLCKLGLRYHRDARGEMRCRLVVSRRCRWFWRTWRLGFGGWARSRRILEGEAVWVRVWCIVIVVVCFNILLCCRVEFKRPESLGRNESRACLLRTSSNDGIKVFYQQHSILQANSSNSRQ